MCGASDTAQATASIEDARPVLMAPSCIGLRASESQSLAIEMIARDDKMSSLGYMLHCTVCWAR